MKSYYDYHRESREAGDIDPSYGMLRYVCDRFELNTEQRYWVAFLYATCYCGPTAFYMYNEFPDYENIDFGRMERWWKENRERVVFQTDRRWTRSRNLWVDQVRSYREVLSGLRQATKFKSFLGSVPEPARSFAAYDAAYEEMGKVRQFGRFSMFLYLEAVHVVTGFPMQPATMDIREAESCRNGLCYAINQPGWVAKKVSTIQAMRLQWAFDNLVQELREQDPRNNVWNIETTLCAYKKYRLGKRWVGYYIMRQGRETAQLQALVPQGVDWSVLWDYRRENLDAGFLDENTFGTDWKRWQRMKENE